jgi:hypothetical protein
MVQSTHVAKLRDARSKPKMEEFVESMEQKLNSVAVTGVRIKHDEEVFASSMEQWLLETQRRSMPQTWRIELDEFKEDMKHDP